MYKCSNSVGPCPSKVVTTRSNVSWLFFYDKLLETAVKLSNKGHTGDGSFVQCMEVVLLLEESL